MKGERNRPMGMQDGIVMDPDTLKTLIKTVRHNEVIKFVRRPRRREMSVFTTDNKQSPTCLGKPMLDML